MVMIWCALFSSLSLANPSSSFLKPYLEIQNFLAKDQFAGVTASATNLEKALLSEKKAAAAKFAKDLSKAHSIEEARTAFEGVSKELLPWARKNKMTDTDLVYCPMKKAYWLQKKGDIQNPYYGKEMLECGVIEERK